MTRLLLRTLVAFALLTALAAGPFVYRQCERLRILSQLQGEWVAELDERDKSPVGPPHVMFRGDGFDVSYPHGLSSHYRVLTACMEQGQGRLELSHPNYDARGVLPKPATFRFEGGVLVLQMGTPRPEEKGSWVGGIRHWRVKD